MKASVGAAVFLLVAGCSPARPTREEAQRILDGIDSIHRAHERTVSFAHASCDPGTHDVQISLSGRLTTTDPSEARYDPAILAFTDDLVAAELLTSIGGRRYCEEGIEMPPHVRCRGWGRMGRYRRSDAVQCFGTTVNLVVAELGPPTVASLEFPDENHTTIVFERRLVFDDEVVQFFNEHRGEFDGTLPQPNDGVRGQVILTRSDEGWNVTGTL